MAATPSKMITLGTLAPYFSIIDTVSEKMLSLTELKGRVATVIMFICNHCPYVKHVNHELIRMAEEYIPKGINFIAISSNDIIKYPDDGPNEMKKTASKLGYLFPYLFDESQQVAKAYDAACTPDFYIYDVDLKLVYRGQLDDSRPGSNIPVTGKDIREALQALLHNLPVPSIQKPSIGCNIKWKE